MSLRVLADRLSIGSKPFYLSFAMPDMLGKLYIYRKEEVIPYKAVLCGTNLYLFEDSIPNKKTEKNNNSENKRIKSRDSNDINLMLGISKVFDSPETPKKQIVENEKDNSSDDLSMMLLLPTDMELNQFKDKEESVETLPCLSDGSQPFLSFYLPDCAVYLNNNESKEKMRSFSLVFAEDTTGGGKSLEFMSKASHAWVEKLCEMNGKPKSSKIPVKEDYLDVCALKSFHSEVLGIRSEKLLIWQDFCNESCVLSLASILRKHNSPQLQSGAAHIFALLSAHVSNYDQQVVFAIPLVVIALANAVLLQPRISLSTNFGTTAMLGKVETKGSEIDMVLDDNILVSISTDVALKDEVLPDGLVYCMTIRKGMYYDDLRTVLILSGSRIRRFHGKCDILVSVNGRKISNLTVPQIIQRIKRASKSDYETTEYNTVFCFAHSFAVPDAMVVNRESHQRTDAATYAMGALDNLSCSFHPSHDEVISTMFSIIGLIDELVRTAIPIAVLLPNIQNDNVTVGLDGMSNNKLYAERIVRASRCIANLCEYTETSDIAIEQSLSTMYTLSIACQNKEHLTPVHSRVSYKRILPLLKTFSRGQQRAILVSNFRMFSSWGFASKAIRQKAASQGILTTIHSILQVAHALSFDLKPNKVKGAGMLFDLLPTDFSFSERKDLFNAEDLVSLIQSPLNKACLFAMRGIAHLSLTPGDTKEEGERVRRFLVSSAMNIMVGVVQRSLSLKHLRNPGGCGFKIVEAVATACDGLSRHAELRDDMLKYGARNAMLAIMTERKVSSIARVQAADVIRRMGRLASLLCSNITDRTADYSKKSMCIIPEGPPSNAVLSRLGVLFQAINSCIVRGIDIDAPALGAAVELLSVIAAIDGAPRVLGMLGPVALLCTALRTVKCDKRFEVAACSTLASLISDSELVPQFRKLTSALLPKLVALLNSSSKSAVRDTCKILFIISQSTAKVKLQIIRAYPEQGLKQMVKLTKDICLQSKSCQLSENKTTVDEDAPLQNDSDTRLRLNITQLLDSLTEVDKHNGSVLPELSVQELFLFCDAEVAVAVSRSVRALANRVSAGLDPPCHAILLPDKCGWLYRMSLKALGFKTWNKRWFVLKDDFLFEYKGNSNKDGRTPRRKIMLSGCEVILTDHQRSSEDQVSIGIKIPNYTEVFVICASSNEATNLWKVILERAIEKANVGRNPQSKLSSSTLLKDTKKMDKHKNGNDKTRQKGRANALSVYRGLFGKKDGVLLLNTNQNEIMSGNDFSPERLEAMIKLTWSQDIDVAFQASRVLAALLPHFYENIIMQHKLAAFGAMGVLRYLDNMKRLPPGEDRSRVLEALWHFKDVLTDDECIPSTCLQESKIPINCLLPIMESVSSKNTRENNTDLQESCNLCYSKVVRKNSACAYCLQIVCKLCGKASVFAPNVSEVVYVCNHCYTNSSKMIMPRFELFKKTKLFDFMEKKIS